MTALPPPRHPATPRRSFRLGLRTLLIVVGLCGGLLAGVRGESLETAGAAIFVVLLCVLTAECGARLLLAGASIAQQFRQQRRWSVLTAAYRHVPLMFVTGLLVIVGVVVSNHVWQHTTAQAGWLVGLAWAWMPLLLGARAAPRLRRRPAKESPVVGNEDPPQKK